jgi:polysaccharide export outer membrane protein
MRRRLSLILAAAAALSGCITSSQAVGTKDDKRGAPERTILGVGDVVEIRVFREPDLAGIYVVSPQGDVDFPLIGPIRFLGKDAYLLADEIKARLEPDYLKHAQVTLIVREHNSQKIHVLGEVNKPGSFAYEPGMTIIQALAYAGSFTKLAGRNDVKVTRLSPGGVQKFTLRVGDMEKGEAPNFDLSPGDIVWVPETIL